MQNNEPSGSPRNDARATLAISATVVLGFGALLSLIWYAHRGEQRQVQVTTALATASQSSSDLAVAVQRVTLLQYGLVGYRTTELKSKLDGEIHRELLAMTDTVEQINASAENSLLAPPTRAIASGLKTLALTFKDTTEKLLLSLQRGDTDRTLVESFVQLSGEIVQSSRDLRDSISRDSIAYAEGEERSRGTVFLATMVLTASIGLLVLVLVYARVRRELSLRRKAEERLLVANGELERFAGTVAHDLNGPLSNLSLAANLIERSMSKKPEVALEMTATMKRETQRLHAMIDGLLRLARLSQSKVKATEFSLRSLIEEIRAGLQQTLHAANASVEITGDDDVWADRALLSNLFQNLIENSIKYSRVDINPVIAIHLQLDGRGATIRYEDNGRGIPVEARSRVFEPFFQCQDRAEIAGLGLGLSVVHKIVLAHGGEISIADKDQEGVCFALFFPFPRDGKREEVRSGAAAETQAAPPGFAS